MKNLLFLLLAMATVTCASAQKISEKEVPQVVKNSLEKAFPNVKELKWEKEHSNYEANFEEGKKEYSLLIDSTGTILETELEIKASQLPAGIKTYISQHYGKQKIKEAAKITNNQGVVTYEAEIKGKDLIFDNSGKFLREVND